MDNKRIYRISILSVIIILLFIVLPGVLSLAVDWLWFNEIGYSNLFSTPLIAKLILGLAVGFLSFGLIYLNIRLSSYIGRKSAKMNFLENANIDVSKYLNKLILATSLVLGLFAGLAASAQWDTALKYLNYTPFGTSDPIFNKDIGYYIFTIPFLKLLAGYLFFIVIVSLIGCFAIYAIKGFVKVPSRLIKIAKSPYVEKMVDNGNFLTNHAAKFHLSLLGIIIFLLLALQTHFISIPELTYSTSDLFVGAGYTDIYANLPIMRALEAVAIICAILLLINIYTKKNRLVYAAIGLYILLGIVQGVYATAIQKLIVVPNELVKESPYILHNITATQKAWGLDNVEKRELAADSALTAEDIDDNELTIKNIRLWDRQPLLDTFSQIQEIRTYYDFISVDNDRYMIDDEYRQIMLSPRELNTNSLPNKSFINERFTFTHGYGLTSGPVNQVTQEGLPVLFTKDLPPVSEKEALEVNRPEIYYGELSSDYVFVNTKAQEFDYPQGEENVFSEYQGSGGVPVNNLLKKALFALHFGSLKIFLSNDLDSDSRVMYYRDITERVEKAMPFLEYDSDPYMVITEDGSLKWIYDAYTVSSKYPYSEMMNNGKNYMRNSVKVVIDAYDGTMEFYLADKEDPLILTYEKMFPGIFKSLNDLPKDLSTHLRYPEDIFNYQTKLYRTYHMDQPQIFYNKEDQWEIPYVNDGGESIDPIMRHLIMKLPGEKQEEFILMIPFTPRQKDNMAAWMVARSDGDNYGKLVVYQFGKQKLIFGPKQINNRINQDAEISRQISLWDQRGSEVIQGNLLVIPIEESLLYVRPLYIRAEGGRIPELKRVIVAYENKIAMEETLDEALAQIFSSGGKDQKTEEAVVKDDDIGKENEKSREDLIKEAKGYFEQAQTAQQNGDWAEYGEYIKKLEETLGKL